MLLNKKQVDGFFARMGYTVEVVERSRQTIDALRARAGKLKKQLEAQNTFLPGDEIHIVTITLCEELQMRAFMDVMENGTIMTIDAEGKVRQKNHSISTFYQMSKMINDTSRKIGLSALDRKELKIEVEKDDGMDD